MINVQNAPAYYTHMHTHTHTILTHTHMHAHTHIPCPQLACMQHRYTQSEHIHTCEHMCMHTDLESYLKAGSRGWQLDHYTGREPTGYPSVQLKRGGAHRGSNSRPAASLCKPRTYPSTSSTSFWASWPLSGSYAPAPS